MRSMLKLSMATVLVASAAFLSAAPSAIAGWDEAGQNSFWTSQSNGGSAAAAPAASTREQYRATYTLSKKDSQPASAASEVQKDPPAFYHAMGTMSSP